MSHATVTSPVVLSQEEDFLPDAPPHFPADGPAQLNGQDVGAIHNTQYTARPTPASDVMLQDLFHNNDDADDDEFASSTSTSDKNDSSPTAAPM